MENFDKTDKKIKAIPTGELLKEKEALLSECERLDLRNLMRGSLLVRNIKCGRPNCRCATGEGHEALYLSSYDPDHDSKTRQVYVKKSESDKIKSSLKQYESLSRIANALSSINVELYRRKELDL